MIGKTVSHYKIIEKIGEGGMGVVYCAEDMRLKRMVALKFLPPASVITESDRERFVQEAQAAASLNHPNICVIHNLEKEDNIEFIAMEFIEGETLQQKVAQGPLDINLAIDYALKIAEALEAAHENEIIHRDMDEQRI